MAQQNNNEAVMNNAPEQGLDQSSKLRQKCRVSKLLEETSPFCGVIDSSVMDF